MRCPGSFVDPPCNPPLSGVTETPRIVAQFRSALRTAQALTLTLRSPFALLAPARIVRDESPVNSAQECYGDVAHLEEAR